MPKLNKVLSGFRSQLKNPSQPAGLPNFVLLGSKAGMSMKDMQAFVRGVAQAHCKAPEIARYRIMQDPKDKERYYFEIHEGGPGLSVLDKVLAYLVVEEDAKPANEEARSIKIALADGFHALIEKPYSELYTIIYPPPTEEELEAQADEDIVVNDIPVSITNFTGEKPLQLLYPEYKVATPIGWLILMGAGAAFLFSGLTYTLMKTNVLDDDLVLAQAKMGLISVVKDNPVWQLENARQQAQSQGKVIHALRKDKKNWTWELRTPTFNEMLNAVQAEEEAAKAAAKAATVATPKQ